MSTPNPAAPVPGRGLPSIPVGLATKLGLVASALSALAALVAAVLQGDHTPETVTGLIVAASSVYAVIRSRGEQNAAATIAAASSSPPSPSAVLNSFTAAPPVGRPLMPDPELDDPALLEEEPELEADLPREPGCPVEEHAAMEARAFAELEASGQAKPTAETLERNNAA